MKFAALLSVFSFSLVSTALCAGPAKVSAPPNDPITQTNLRGKLQPISRSDSIDKGWTVDGTFLLWNAKVDGFQFAETVNLKGLIPNTLPTQINASIQCDTLPFDKWDPGFQVGLGYIFSEREQWHTRLSWTRFRTESRRTVHSSTDLFTQYIVPLWVNFLTGPQADYASAHWDLDYDTVDLELSRQFFVGKWLSVNPKLGVRGAWITQDYRVKYHALFNTGADVFPEPTSFKAGQSFNGVGFKLGSDLQFYICKHLSILGNLSSSLLWGNYHLQEKATGFIFVGSSTSISEAVKIKAARDMIRANVEGQLGLKWQQYFHQDKFRFGFSTLYSFSYWFRQNNSINQLASFAPNLQQPAVSEVINSGDLQLQGVNFQLEFDF